MAYPVRESFDSYADVASAGVGLRSRVFSRTDGNQGRSLVSGRYGGQALKLEGNGNTIVCADYIPLGTPQQGFSIHAAMKLQNDYGIAKLPHLYLAYDDTIQVGIALREDGSIDIMRGGSLSSVNPGITDGTVIASTANGLFNPFVYNSFGIRGLIDQTAGFVGIQINGDEVILATNLDTQEHATEITANRLYFTETHNESLDRSIEFDDVVLSDDDSAYLPELKIEPLTRVSDGANLDWAPSTGTAHYAMIDGAIATTAEYLEASTIGNYDLINCGSLSTIPAEIIGVNVVGYANKTDVTTRAITLGLRSNATDADGDDLYLATAVTQYSQFYEQDPDTTAAWTAAGVNAMQLKPEVAV